RVDDVLDLNVLIEIDEGLGLIGLDDRIRVRRRITFVLQRRRNLAAIRSDRRRGREAGAAAVGELILQYIYAVRAPRGEHVLRHRLWDELVQLIRIRRTPARLVDQAVRGRPADAHRDAVAVDRKTAAGRLAVSIDGADDGAGDADFALRGGGFVDRVLAVDRNFSRFDL